jgi:virulence-associated protein VapD
MFAIAFDLVVADTERQHPKGVSQAYTDIADVLQRFGFRRIQGSVYSVRDIRAFRIEQWSDFTPIIKSP